MNNKFSLTLACVLPLLVVTQDANAFQKISDTRVERIAPLTIEQVKQAIEVQPGYEVELVASEPLIKSPVAIAFDADGALWVVEMVDYSEQENDALGRLSKLTDTDGDGVMDQAQVVAQGLSWPTALATLQKRVWVAAAPLVQEFKPQESGSQANWNSKTILEGLGRQNVQGLANSFHFGLDGRLHLSTSSNGGQLTANSTSPIVLPASPTNVSGRDIAFDLVTGKLSSVVGYGQHGMDFSPWGDRYVTSNSDHLQQVVAWYLPELTDAALSKSVAWRRSIAADGSQAEVFRISPVESWRTIRTQMRLAGISTGILEGQGRASGYFTSATGVTIYDGDQWPTTEHPIALIADVGSNLVHRKRLVRNGVASKGERIDSQSEFLRSKDTWFRPVQFSNGPDGCLYIVDMARETIEHPKSIPEPIKSQVDLTSG
ncbi:MAG: PVC-type heme-binding CxxCH protein, partial [Pirellula sp.]